MRANLTVWCGPMFSGKSTSLLKEFLWRKHREPETTFLIKPAFDNRYSETDVVTHSGLKATARNVSSPAQLIDVAEYATSIFVDECQFFTDPHFSGDFPHHIATLLDAGIDVYAAGLDSDWQGLPFEVTANLLAMADEVHKLKAYCAVSGQPATKTYKKTKSGGKVELGSSDIYEPRSNQFWNY